MTIYYLLPVVLIAGAIAYTFMMQAKVSKGVAEGRGAQMFHDGWAGFFDALLPNEHLIAVWMGQAYIEPKEGAGQIAGNIAKQAALGMVGVSTYTPGVYAGVTTLGRVLVSEEYSEGGSRGNYKVVAAFPPGAKIAVGPAARDHRGAPPKNPYSLTAQFELVRLMSADEQYLAWLTSEGAMLNTTTFVSITTVLPITADRAASIWQAANHSMAAAAAA
jgi:hypothetical protein